MLRLLPILLFALLAGLFWAGMARKNPDELPSTFVGQAAPALGQGVLPGVAGFGAKDLQGKVSVVNFWASWCPPCRAEHPTLVALAARGDLQVLGVNMMDQEAAATGFLAEHGNPFAGVIFDPKGKMRLDWGVTAPPETFIIGRDGKVAFRFVGPLVGDDYQQRFLPALEAALQ